MTTNNVSVHQWRDELLAKTTLRADDIGEFTGLTKDIKPVTISTYQMLTYRCSKDALLRLAERVVVQRLRRHVELHVAPTHERVPTGDLPPRCPTHFFDLRPSVEDLAERLRERLRERLFVFVGEYKRVVRERDLVEAVVPRGLVGDEPSSRAAERTIDPGLGPNFLARSIALVAQATQGVAALRRHPLISTQTSTT